MSEAIMKAGNNEIRLSMETVAGFEALQRAAGLLSACSLVPKIYQGKENMPNCAIAMELASRIGMSPLMVMQNLYIVQGKPGWSAQFLIAAVNASGRFSSLRYESRGTPGRDDYAVRAWAIERDTGTRLDGAWITWAMVRDEGWLGKPGSKWKTMPEQMGMYRAAAFWQRAYAPEIGMGILTREEVEDTVVETTAVTIEPPAAKRAKRAEPEPAPEPEAPAAPAPAEVVDEQTGEVTPAGDEAMRLESKLRAAAGDRVALMDLGSEIRAAHKAGRISDEQRKVLQAVRDEVAGNNGAGSGAQAGV